MTLSLKQTRAMSGLAEVLYSFLPGSGSSIWKGHVSFPTVAAKVGVGAFWRGGSKKPAIVFLLSQTFEQRLSSFERLIIEIVRSGIAYREKAHQPITTDEIDEINGHILELGFKFPELWDSEFRNLLQQTTGKRAREHVAQVESQQQELTPQQRHAQELGRLKDDFLQLANESNRNQAGLSLEKLLNRLFGLFDLQPHPGFRVIGEQIDGSFELDGDVYLLESKWEKSPLPQADLLVFRGKIEGKSTFTRGVFIALNGITREAETAITQGKSPSFFVMNGYDLMKVLDGAITLTDFLRARRRLLGERGLVCAAFSEVT